MKSRKREKIKEIERPNQKRTKIIVEKKNFKYLWILEVVTIKQVERKEKIRNEYLKWIKTSRNQALLQKSH